MKTWILEFSKRLVVWCSVFYFIAYSISLGIIIYLKDTTALEALLNNLNTVLVTCVFGYLVKAGVENVFKIKGSDKEN